ncbi:MAG: orotate phosphoribosyltransferase [Clostridia bacterium]|nr:orotate phosphoribosyltransferase [Clostridia bacterium]
MSTLDILKYASKGTDLHLRVAAGHFATGNRHSNYYIDVAWQKARLSEARAVAEKICSYYYADTVVDTILCLDGTEVIGACLADSLSKGDFANMNSHKTIYVVTPEITGGNQIFFRDNIVPMIAGKNVMILAATIASGKMAQSAINAVRYYGGKVSGVSAFFSTIDQCDDLPVRAVFGPKDLEGYQSYHSHECPLCNNGVKLDALVNSYGISKL